MAPRISISIPTYNRARFLPYTLESVLSQDGFDPDSVQIVISDNASTDNTAEVVARFQQRTPAIQYHRNVSNLGADRNYLRVIELATAEYCWFLGSDDALRPGALRRMLTALSSGDDIYLCGRTNCNYWMRPLNDERFLTGVDESTFNLSDTGDLLRYFGSASRGLSALFSYLSAIAFRRSKWHSAHYDAIFTGTLYSHVYKLFSMIPLGCTLRYLPDPLVYCRGNNSSFAEGGKARCFIDDISGYLLLADRLFGSRPEIRRGFLDVVIRSHRRLLYRFSILVKDKETWVDMKKKVLACGFSPRDVRSCDRLFSVRWALRPAVNFVESVRALGLIQ